MKKIVTMLISLLLVLGMAVGLVACTDDPAKPAAKEYTEAGGTTNAQTAKTYVAAREDSRTAAFSAFKADGTKVADFKAMANAINAATAAGVDGYVTKTNSTTKLFVNREGYVKDVNEDVYWYYENGTSLDSFYCFDSVETVKSLKDSKYTVVQGSGYGKTLSQSWNSYNLLDKTGAPSTKEAAMYELTSTLDANVLAFPTRFGGMTKSSYKIEASKMEIVPAYTTGDETNPVYAFMGYYMWQDYYVINVGIACDTKTGNWYPYIGTSRDDSASDTIYMEKDCVMTSTWNAEKGAFIPDSEFITITIESKLLEDADGKYQVNDFTAAASNGSKYTRRFTESVLNEYFPGKPLGIENSFIFVAGLDIKNSTNDSSVKAKAADFFNGAQLKNLTVTEASAYVPTVEQLSDEDYGYEIKLERGKEHNLVMAKGGSDMIDYSIINNSLFSSYTKDGEKDVYNFNFDQSAALKPTEANVLSTVSKANQDKIDALASITEENAKSRKAEIVAVTGMYGEDEKGTNSTLTPKYRNVLNFTQYFTALEVLKKAETLSEDAKAFVAAFKDIAPLSSYVMKGWQAAADAAEKAGFFYDDYLLAKAAMVIYDKLDADNKDNITTFIKESVLNDWKLLVEEMNVLVETAEYKDAKILTTTLSPLADKPTDVELSASTAFKQVLYWSLQIKNGGKWEGEGTKVMDGDNSWFPSTYIVSCYKAFLSTGLTAPTWVADVLEEIGYASFLDAFDSIYNTVKIAMEIKAGNLTTVAALSDEAKAKLNIYWISSYKINGNLAWNWNSGAKFETYMGKRVARVVALAGGNLVNGEAALKAFEYFKIVEDFLTGAGYTANANGWGTTAETIA